MYIQICSHKKWLNCSSVYFYPQFSYRHTQDTVLHMNPNHNDIFYFILSLYLPQMPSLTREDGMLSGLWPAFVQWNVPLGQAGVPGSSLPSWQSQQSSFTQVNGMVWLPSKHVKSLSGGYNDASGDRNQKFNIHFHFLPVAINVNKILQNVTLCTLAADPDLPDYTMFQQKDCYLKLLQL